LSAAKNEGSTVHLADGVKLPANVMVTQSSDNSFKLPNIALSANETTTTIKLPIDSNTIKIPTTSLDPAALKLPVSAVESLDSATIKLPPATAMLDPATLKLAYPLQTLLPGTLVTTGTPNEGRSEVMINLCTQAVTHPFTTVSVNSQQQK